MVAMTPQAWYEWLNCSILGYITAASMMIHHPVKKRTPAAMEATVFRFSPQSMHSEHLEPSRNPDIFSGHMCNCRFTQWPHPSPFFAAQLLDVFKGRPALQTGGTGRGHAWADPDAPPSDERAQLRSSGELSPRQEVAPQVARSQPRQRRPGAGTRPSPRVRTRPAASPSRPHSRPSPMSRRVSSKGRRCIVVWVRGQGQNHLPVM